MPNKGKIIKNREWTHFRGGIWKWDYLTCVERLESNINSFFLRKKLPMRYRSWILFTTTTTTTTTKSPDFLKFMEVAPIFHCCLNTVLIAYFYSLFWNYLLLSLYHDTRKTGTDYWIVIGFRSLFFVFFVLPKSICVSQFLWPAFKKKEIPFRG